MNSRKFILRKTAVLALGEVICCSLMVGLFALLGYFSYKVVVGGVLGMLLAVGNFFFMAIASFSSLHLHYSTLLLQTCYRQVKIEKQISLIMDFLCAIKNF
jgi:hypothetical protein